VPALQRVALHLLDFAPWRHRAANREQTREKVLSHLWTRLRDLSSGVGRLQRGSGCLHVGAEPPGFVAPSSSKQGVCPSLPEEAYSKTVCLALYSGVADAIRRMPTAQVLGTQRECLCTHEHGGSKEPDIKALSIASMNSRHRRCQLSYDEPMRLCIFQWLSSEGAAAYRP
jgi:hypothetical protein